MKYIAFAAFFLCNITVACAQDWYTKTGSAKFYSHTALEDIKAENNEVLAFLNSSNGDMVFEILIKGFRFPKASMQSHFNNPDYMNSDKFPKAQFKGKILDMASVNFGKDGTYKVSVQGTLIMHGVSQKITVPGTIAISDGKPLAHAVFMVKRTDFGISTESFTATKIAEVIEVTIHCAYQPFK